MNSHPKTQTAEAAPQLILPLFLTQQNKLLYAFIAATFGTIIYLVPNYYPLIQPRYLTMSSLDLAVPFVPWTFWIYISEYLLFFSAYFLSKNMANTNRYLYSFFCMQWVACLIFFIWPTTFPRELFPLVKESTSSLTYAAFSSFRAVDQPTNCCPSLHVASVYLAAFVFLEEQKSKFPFYFLWASAVAFSTLTTKQHYFIDVVSGLGLAVVCWWIFHRRVAYRAIDELQPNR